MTSTPLSISRLAQMTAIALFLLPCTSVVAEDQKSIPLEISAAGALEWHRNDRQYIAKKDVIVTQGEMTLTADELVADYNDSNNKETPQGSENANAPATNTTAPDIYRLTATGNVTIKTRVDTIKGSKAIYNRTENTAVMDGPVTIVRGPNTLTGARARVNLVTGVSTLEGDKAAGGRVKGIFYTQSSTAKDAIQKDKAP
jgi:lipopolysaccharide transport protein LptA